MSYSIVMPQLGLTMTEGAVSEWLKKPGDPVQKNEAVFIVSTDKVEMEVESIAAGTMGEILVQPGETVPVGATLAYLEGVDEDEQVSDGASPSAQIEMDSEPTPEAIVPAKPEATNSAPVSPRAQDRPQISPRAKRLAAELGVSLDGLQGTGEGGRIVEEDVRKGASASVAPSAAPKALEPTLKRRQIIAERLIKSIQTIPTFSVSAEANAEKLLALRHQLQSASETGSIKLTVTDLLLAVYASVMKKRPDLNSAWENDRPSARTSVDIGLAVATAQGVVAPVMQGVDQLDLQQLLSKRNDLVERGRNGKLTLGELEGGIATLSNLGMYRVDRFQAIISPGQSSILAVGSIRNRPWVDGALVVKPTVILTLTVDHRIADGEGAATFLGELVDLVENPSRLQFESTRQPAVTSGRGRNG